MRRPDRREAEALLPQGDVRPEVPEPGEWVPAAILRTEHYAMVVYVGADEAVRHHGEPNLEFQTFLFQEHAGAWYWRSDFGGSMGGIASGWSRRPEHWSNGRALFALGHGGGSRPMEPWHAPAIRQVELLVAQPVVEVRTTTATATTSVPMRTSLGFTMVISEGEGPMEVTAHDDEGNTLDRWVFPDAN